MDHTPHRENSTDKAAATASGSYASATSGATIVLPIIEERAVIGKREVETGIVTIARDVFEQTEPVHVIVSHDECRVEHVPAGYFVEVAPEVRWEGDTMIVPVLREEAVVVKKLRLVEELHITKASIQATHTEQVTLRREHLTVTRTKTDGSKEAL